MTKREQYNLEFTIISTPGFRARYHCFPLEPFTQTNIVIAELLDTLDSKHLFDYVFENAKNALNGVPYENYMWFEEDHIDVFITPPNARISNAVDIPLTDLKGLLDEWLVFLDGSIS